TDDAAANVWYVDLERMLKWGSIYYAMYFIVSFPNVFRLDEQGRDWTLGRTVMEACAVSAISLLLLDLWALLLGPVVV
ncbi:MAG: cycloeucalenol cycloisomerase, partial [Bacteroidia bacterium]